MKRLVGTFVFIAASAHAQTFTGFVDAAYLWNDNRPANHQNFVPGTGTSGRQANELTLNLAQLQWTRATSATEPIGFTLALVAGEGTDVVHAGEPRGADAYRYLYQASLAYRLRNGVVLEAGVYPSHIGFEGFYSKDNWNYTRSWLGEFSPYYQAGVKASYSFNSNWSGQLHLLNGWQLINDNNDSKAIGTQLAYVKGPISASLNTFVGREPDHTRTFGDLVVLYRVTPKLQLGASVDAGASDAKWDGVAAYARWSIDDRHAVAVRAEEFRDPHNGISGTPQKLREATLTYEARPRANLILKLETRCDRSTADVFGTKDARRNRQLLAIAGAVVTF
ncbi:MAG: hypothetical protein QOI24_116 [Acidobacteriota bacterium]|nr:hypothetical protein [Acidobacteriota bacterium]